MATKPSPVTATIGAKLGAADWNGGVVDTWNFIDRLKPVCIAWSAAVQTPASGALTTLTLDSEMIDTDGMHSTVTNTSRITFQTAGYYRIWGATTWTTNATGQRGGLIKANGTTVVELTYTMIAASPTFFTSVPLTQTITSFDVGDYIELQGYQASGGALNTFSSVGVRTFLAAEYVGTLV